MSTSWLCRVPQTDASGSYFGCIVGRCANRIDGATFTTPPRGPSSPDGAAGSPLGPYQLEANDGGRHALHGGSRHWGRQAWLPARTTLGGSPAVEFTLTSRDGDAGYPGEVAAAETEGRGGGGGGGAELRVVMLATASAPTPVNMVQHTHWNLAGRRAVAQVGPPSTPSCPPHSCHAVPRGAKLCARARAPPWRRCARRGVIKNAHGHNARRSGLSHTVHALRDPGQISFSE
jgi:galactose mutarotase-like enzyme